MLKNVEAGPVKSAIVVTFCINLILAYEVKSTRRSCARANHQPTRGGVGINTNQIEPNHHTQIQVMLIPPREYVERWLVKPSRPYYR